MVDLLGAVIQACRVAQTYGVGGREQTEIFVWRDDFVLIQKGQFAVMFQHALDHKHHIRAARIIFIKDNRNRVAQGPRQDAFVEFGNLNTIFQFDRVFADQVNPADVAV